MRGLALVVLAGCATAPARVEAPPAPRPPGLEVSAVTEKGVPILLVTVIVTGGDGQTRSELTDVAGRAAMPDLAPGRYDVQVVYGEMKEHMAVDVAAGAGTEVVARFDFSKLTGGFTMHCRGPAIDPFRAVQGRSFGAGELRNLPWRGRTAGAVLDAVSGTPAGGTGP